FEAFGVLGTGLLAGYGTPDARVLVGLRYLRRHTDRDGDGILDRDDSCAGEPEDVDGFEDSDGCPEPDNDGDGVRDENDRCPLVPGVSDFAGCPDRDADGVEDVADQCPDTAGAESLAGCPDTDGDGLRDLDDKCIDAAEDKDGFEDDDGCPETDNDQDGIDDRTDKCPNEPESKNEFEDEDGCPDQKPYEVKVTKERIEIREKVYFATNLSRVLPESFPVLDAIADTMVKNPEVRRLLVEGHTDAEAEDEFNLKLSQARADAVKTYLVKKGVASERLETKGFGETKPIADNDSAEGRERNRRVEFTVLEWVTEDGPTTPEPKFLDAVEAPQGASTLPKGKPETEMAPGGDNAAAQNPASDAAAGAGTKETVEASKP
ncbi:MAG: OmpA family protein, partial [Myxococcota bacterium]